jgi:hypothetical protein
MPRWFAPRLCDRQPQVSALIDSIIVDNAEEVMGMLSMMDGPNVRAVFGDVKVPTVLREHPPIAAVAAFLAPYARFVSLLISVLITPSRMMLVVGWSIMGVLGAILR